MEEVAVRGEVHHELIDHGLELVLALLGVVPRDVGRGVRVVRGELLGDLLVHLLLRELELIGGHDDHGLGLLEGVEIRGGRAGFLLALVLLGLGLCAILLGSLRGWIGRGGRRQFAGQSRMGWWFLGRPNGNPHLACDGGAGRRGSGRHGPCGEASRDSRRARVHSGTPPPSVPSRLLRRGLLARAVCDRAVAGEIAHSSIFGFQQAVCW